MRAFVCARESEICINAMISLLLRSDEPHCKARNSFNLVWNKSDDLFSLLFINPVSFQKIIYMYIYIWPNVTHTHTINNHWILSYSFSLSISLSAIARHSCRNVHRRRVKILFVLCFTFWVKFSNAILNTIAHLYGLKFIYKFLQTALLIRLSLIMN